MNLMRCSKPGCGNTYSSSTLEFEDGYCVCGAALVPIEEVVQPIDQILEDDRETPRFENEVHAPVEPQAPVEPPAPNVTIENEEKEQAGPEIESPAEEDETPIEAAPVIEEQAEGTVEGDIEAPAENSSPIEVPQAAGQESGENPAPLENTEDDDRPIYLIGKNNEIIFKQDAGFEAVFNDHMDKGFYGDPYADFDGDRVQVYLNGKVLRTYPLEYDEMLIGREHEGISPDIDYTSIDMNRFISRRHALIYRQQNEYFIRNLSKKNSVHVNKEVLQEKEFRCLQDGDRIVLSRKYGLVFKKRSESENS